jgi:hypothetical protein
MNDAFSSYQDAQRKCEEAFRRLEEIRVPIIEVAWALQNNPRNFSFADTSVALPAVAIEVVRSTRE